MNSSTFLLLRGFLPWNLGSLATQLLECSGMMPYCFLKAMPGKLLSLTPPGYSPRCHALRKPKQPVERPMWRELSLPPSTQLSPENGQRVSGPSQEVDV